MKYFSIDDEVEYSLTTDAGEFFDAPSHTSISGSVTYSADLRDGGDKALLPFVGVGASVRYIINNGGLSVTSPGGVTDSWGTFSTIITVTGGISGDEATVTFTSDTFTPRPPAVQTVTVTIP